MAKSAWMVFLAEYYKKNKSKGISYKQAMVAASKVFKKSKGKADSKKKRSPPSRKGRRKVKRSEEE